MTSGRPDSGQVSSESAMAKTSGCRKKLSEISHAKHQERLAARRLYEAQIKTKQLQREQQAISLVRAAINSTAEAKIKALEHEIVELKSLVTQKAQLIKARDAEKAQLIKDKHDATVYHMSHHDKLYEKIKKLKEQNEKLKNLVAEAGQQNGKLMAEKAQLIKDRDDVKERNEKLKSENAKLWHQNDAMAEAGLKRMAKSGF